MELRQQMNIISTCNCRITELYGDWAKQHGLSYHTMITLYALDLEPSCTQKQIAQAWMISKQTVNTVVKDLERKGYVRFAEGRDQKEKLICFTEAGRAFAAKTLEELYRLEDRVMARLGPTLRRAMVESNLAFAEAMTKEVHGE